MWGGEFLVADFNGFERVGHLLPVALPGGAAAIREPWRMALAWTALAVGNDAAARLGERLDPRWSQVLALVAEGGKSRPILTTSVGRLFDAVAALIGLRSRVSYEGQAAIELEMLARTVPRASAPKYPTEIVEAADPEAQRGARPVAAHRHGARRARAGNRPRGDRSRVPRRSGARHGRLGARLARRHGLDTVALSGGVFQNVRFSDIVEDALGRGLTVLVHESVPPNDGGISIGQAAIAALGAADCGL